MRMFAALLFVIAPAVVLALLWLSPLICQAQTPPRWVAGPTVTIVAAMPTDPGSSQAHFPRTVLFATWLNDPGSMSRRSDVAVAAARCPMKLARMR